MSTRKAALAGGAVIALNLGGTKLASAFFTGSGRPRAKRVVALKGRTGRAVGAAGWLALRRRSQKDLLTIVRRQETEGPTRQR